MMQIDGSMTPVRFMKDGLGGRWITMRIIVLLLIFVPLLFSCHEKLENPVNNKTAERTEIETKQPGYYKEPIFRGQLLYGSDLRHAQVESISELLDMYSKEELDTILNLDIARQNLQEIDSLERLPNLEDLTLGACKITSMKGLEMAPKLKGLNLSQNPIGKIEYLETLKDIEEIYIANSQITKIEGLAGLQKLREIDLSGNQLTKIEGLSDLPSLERLSLSGNQLVDYSGLLEIKTIKEISITSLENIVDDNAVAVFTEWNKRFPAQALEW